MNTTSALTLVIASTLSAVAVSMVLLIGGRVIGPLPLSINQTTTNKMSTFDTTGESSVTVIPDEATVSLGIGFTQPTVKQAQENTNSLMTSLMEKLSQMGIEKEDIKTTNYSVYPEYDYQAPTRRTTGFRVNSTLNVKLSDFDKVNEVIDAATSLGINEVNGVSFGLSKEKEAEAKQQARQEAIEDAKANADELSSLAGMRLGKIVNIWESQPGSPMPYQSKSMEVMMDTAALSSPTQIEPGSSEYTYSVTLSYETL